MPGAYACERAEPPKQPVVILDLLPQDDDKSKITNVQAL
jgi:hypothetical protein